MDFATKDADAPGKNACSSFSAPDDADLAAFGRGLNRPEDGYDDKGWNHIEIAVFLTPHNPLRTTTAPSLLPTVFLSPHAPVGVLDTTQPASTQPVFGAQPSAN